MSRMKQKIYTRTKNRARLLCYEIFLQEFQNCLCFFFLYHEELLTFFRWIKPIFLEDTYKTKILKVNFFLFGTVEMIPFYFCVVQPFDSYKQFF